MNVLDFISVHGLNEIEENIEIRKLIREVAHLEAIADINDRVLGNTSVYYETFDGTNDHSPGRIDLTKGKLTIVGSQCKVASEGFKVGQEVSIFDKTNPSSKRVGVINSIGEPVDGLCAVTFTNHDSVIQGLPTDSQNLEMCRSMLHIVDNKPYLYPDNFLEFDIRISIQMDDGYKTFTIISWIEHEKDMSSSNITASGTPVLREMKLVKSRPVMVPRPKGINIECVPAHTGKVHISWDSPDGIFYTHIFKGVHMNLDNPDKLVEVLPGDTSCEIDNLEWGRQDFTIAHVSIDGEYSLSYGYCVLKDSLPPSKVSNVQVDTYYKSEDKVVFNLKWDNPTEKDFSHVDVYVNGEEIESSTQSCQFEVNAGTMSVVNFISRDVNGNYQSHIENYVAPNPIEYFGYEIDFSKTTDPTDSVSYIGSAVGTEVANHTSLGGWENKFPFCDMRICMVSRSTGDVVAYVSKDDYSLLEDGSDNTYYKNISYMTMLEIPKIYSCVENKDNKLIVKFSTDSSLPEYKAYHFTSNGVEKSKMYISVYPLTKDCSCYSGQSPVAYSLKVFNNMVPTNMRVQDYSSICLVQKLFVLAFKSLDSRRCLGKGSNKIHLTGEMDRSGFVYGGDEGVKFLGIENIYGGISQYIPDIKLSEDFKLIGLDNIKVHPTDQYICDVVGDNNHTFIPVNSRFAGVGECFSDRVQIDTIPHSRVGVYNRDMLDDINPESLYGHYTRGDGLGIFSISFKPMAISDTVSSIGARLSMLI